MAQQEQESAFPPQQQDKQPGLRSEMEPQPRTGEHTYRGCGNLEGKVAVITGGDSGIGRAVAIAFAKEGASVAIIYKDEHADAEDTKRQVEKEGRKCITISGDVGDEAFCRDAVRASLKAFGSIHILVNNAAEQHQRNSLTEISEQQLDRTFRTNIYSMFFMTKAVLPHLTEGGSILNTTSVTAYAGHPGLVDYASTKGEIVAFTRSLSLQLAEKGIRVNAVAPGPIWTPLIPASFDEEHVASFGKNTPMERAGQPDEVAPCYVFLASSDASYISGQVLHPNGGRIVNG